MFCFTFSKMFMRCILLLAVVTLGKCLPVSEGVSPEAPEVLMAEDNSNRQNNMGGLWGRRDEGPMNGDGLWGKRTSDVTNMDQQNEGPGLWGKRMLREAAQQRFAGGLWGKRNIVAEKPHYGGLWGKRSMLTKNFPAKKDEEKKEKPDYYGGLWG